MTALLPVTQFPPRARIEQLGWAVGLLLVLLGAVIQYDITVSGDKVWLLVAAGKWLDGKKLYVDIFEVNPPLIIWIYALPVWAARHVGGTDGVWLFLLGIGLVGGSAGLSLALLRRHPALAEAQGKRLQFLLIFFFVFLFLTSPLYFMDRDYVFIVCAAPFLLRWMPGLTHANHALLLRIGVALMGAVGFAIKPHCLLVLAGLELACMVRERRLFILVSLENRILYACGALYLALVWTVTPDYVTTVLPMALITYSQYNAWNGGLIFALIASLTFAMTFVDFQWRKTSPYRADILYFIILSAAFLAYALANNGWGYTYNPLMSVVLLGTCWVRWEFLYFQAEADRVGMPSKPFMFGARTCLWNYIIHSVAVLLVLYFVTGFDCSSDVSCGMEKRFFSYIQNHKIRRFGTITPSFAIWPNIAHETSAAWVTRFNHLWMLPKFAVEDAAFAKAHADIPAYVAHALAEDMNRYRPDVMIVDTSDTFYNTGLPFDLISYLSAYPEFARAWAPYRNGEDVVYGGKKKTGGRGVHGNDNYRYAIFVRKPVAPE